MGSQLYVTMAEAIAGYKTTKEILKAGQGGTVVTKGCTATVHATGVVKETGKKFWSTKDPGQKPFSYQAGVGKVITGGDQGCLGMSIGEERLPCMGHSSRWHFGIHFGVLGDQIGKKLP